MLKNNLHHPYVFVGIKGMKKGEAYESLRSNIGYFLYDDVNKSLPPAELQI